MWNVLGNATSDHEMCLRQKWLQRSVQFRNLPRGMCWGMLPLLMECVRGKSSSSALLVFLIEMFHMKLRWGMLLQAANSV